jgi:hypothetical protein
MPDAAGFWRRLFLGYLCLSVVAFLIVVGNYLVDRNQLQLMLTAQELFCQETMKENERLKADLVALALNLARN